MVCGDWAVLSSRAVHSQRLKLPHLCSSSRIVDGKLIEITYKIHRLCLLTFLCGELTLMATPSCRRVWKISSLLLLRLRGNVCNDARMKDRMDAWRFSACPTVCTHRFVHAVCCPWSLSCVQLFCDPVGHSPSGSSVRGILQEGILEYPA